MKKRILIISGGISKERVVSLDTGKQVAVELKKNGYNVKISEPDFQLLKTIKSFKRYWTFSWSNWSWADNCWIFIS